MKPFLPYVQYLEDIVARSPQYLRAWRQRAAMALDGEPGRKLCETVDLETRREAGAFFTGRDLARKLVVGSASKLRKLFFFDPACGAGDLLLAVARQLPVRRTLQSTLDFWGTCLAGCDPYDEFIRATRARLVLLALQRGVWAKETDLINLRKVFPLIRVSDGLRPSSYYSRADRIIVNPPYGYIDAPKKCSWASGSVTAAGVFFEACLRNSSAGTRITALLPDVLRSGTRYEKWRQLVGEHASINKVQPYGVFDQKADVDVFILDVVKKSAPTARRKTCWTRSNPQDCMKVADVFTVQVGPVVPHRHPQTGPRAPYIHARTISTWSRVKRITEIRRFNGKLIQPPFVAIRRTSRPGDKYRATGTLITVDGPVAVENHLIVCSPRDGTIKSCRRLLRQLRNKQSNDWLNSRIRCRHLTVSSIKELPINDGQGTS